MPQRAQLFLEMRRYYDELCDKLVPLLEEAGHKSTNTSDKSLVDLFVHQKEIDPELDVEQILGLLERYDVDVITLKVATERFREAKSTCEEALDGCPFSEAHLDSTSLIGHGSDHEEVRLNIHAEDIEVNIDSPPNEDEGDESFASSEDQLRYEIEQWLLEEL